MSLIPSTVPGAVPEANRAALRRRWNQVRPMLILGLLVLPVGQLTIFGWVFIDGMGLGSIFLMILPGFSTAFVLWQLARKNTLLTPSEWKYSTLINAILSIPFLLIPLLGPARVEYIAGIRGPLILTAVLLPPVCLLLVLQARRILVAAPVSVVAGSDFVLTYPLRSERWSASVILDKDRLRWEATTNEVGNGYGSHGSRVDVTGAFPLSAVLDTSVRIVREDDDHRSWMRGQLWKLHCPLGPALVLHAKDGEWLMPMNAPDRLAPIVLARAEHLRAERARARREGGTKAF
ncbi:MULTISPECIES: hypothetical protein [Actinoalloteichus]|uniref:Uncharacterized protein n=1 Tax=Actinoalloteichus fjordicus TaxID=1612552 RepID=A0AAC9PQQ7_9PSEU|nr:MULTISPECIES: hypothetical protein [Actinoalloteichus]APU13340.1 hypothetical protein UA74_06335 [Actinoalloteichus fjordicus]APU19290.1 hypothetical protein UA75_06335 [Actinoalloteichus sp. GBA129-24]